MVRWHHRLDGRDFEQTQGDSEGQGSLACCNPGGHKELDTTEQLNLNEVLFSIQYSSFGEKEMAPHSSVLARRIPGTGEPGGLLSVGSHRVGHD